MIPRVYFAGKVRKNCYRTAFGDRIMSLGNTECCYEGARFLYWGPFAASCDHGCFHSLGQHGMPSEEYSCGGSFVDEYGKTIWTPDRDEPRPWIIKRCYRQIDSCDIFYAYIDSLDCYGTLLETGYALGKGKSVYVVFSDMLFDKSTYEGFEKAELWFLREDPRATSIASKCPLALLNDAICTFWGKGNG